MRETTRLIAADAWWSGDWRTLPIRRRDAAGEEEEPLTLQWAGDLSALERRLAAAGWQRPVPWTPRTTLVWLSPHMGAADLPVLPELDAGRLPALTLIRPGAGSAGRMRRLVLRLWPSGVVLGTGKDGTTPLWLGAVVTQRLSRVASLLTLSRAEPDVDDALRQLASDLPGARTVERAGQAVPARWDGRVLLAGPALRNLAEGRALENRDGP